MNFNIRKRLPVTKVQLTCHFVIELSPLLFILNYELRILLTAVLFLNCVLNSQFVLFDYYFEKFPLEGPPPPTLICLQCLTTETSTATVTSPRQTILSKWLFLSFNSDVNWSWVDETTKEGIGLQSKDDGEFWMSFKDFCKHFSEVTICLMGTDFCRDGTSDQTGKTQMISSQIFYVGIACCLYLTHKTQETWMKDK